MLVDRSALLPDRDPIRATGVAVTAYGGVPYVLVAGYGEANRLFRGHRSDAGSDDGDGGGTAGDATLVDAVESLRRATARGSDRYGEAAPVADPAGHAVGVAAADADGDGVEECYVHNAGAFAREVVEPEQGAGVGSPEPDRLLDPHGTAGGADADGGAGASSDDTGPDGWLDLLADGRNRRGRNLRVGRSVAALDRTGDGTYAFLVTGDASPVRLQTVAGGSVTDRAASVGIDFLGGGRSVLAGPVRRPSSDDAARTRPAVRMDLFLGMERGPNLLLRNDGGGFTDFAPERGVSDTHGDARGAALVDLGGELGLALGTDGGRNRLWRLGDGAAVDITPPAFAEPGPVRTVVAADLDNDGAQELFVTCHGAPNRLFRRPPARYRDDVDWAPVDPEAAAEPDRPTTGAVAADLDGDGALELLVAHGGAEPEPLAVYGHPDAGANDWLRVRPRTQRGAPARGARVALETETGPTQHRVVDAGSGYCCQGEPVAHFGLRDGVPTRVTVAWPDGETTARIEAPEPCRTLDVPVPE